FSGNPLLSRIEPRGYFDWEMQDPALVKAVPRETFGLRWSGTLKVNQAGDYQLGLIRAECHACGRIDAARLYIDDKELLNDNRRAGESTFPQTARLHLE